MKTIEPPARIAVLPKPGEYLHPSYGTISISPERNAHFVENFNAGIYQSRIPIDAEHETKLSGALGWITRLHQCADGSVDADVEWTPSGETLLRDDAYAFVSAEWYDEWVAPDTKKTHTDVLIGAALTTRPFFKDGSLRSLLANERGIYVPTRKDNHLIFHALPPKAATPPPKGDPMPLTLSDEQAKQFQELQARETAREAEIVALKKANETQADALKQTTESLAKIANERRKDRFFAEVRGKSDANGMHWMGDVTKNVEMLEFLAEKAGEESDQFKAYVETNRATAKMIQESALFTERGTSISGEPVTAKARFTAEVETLVKADPKLSRGTAIKRVASEHPDLYLQYRDEQNKIRG